MASFHAYLLRTTMYMQHVHRYLHANSTYKYYRCIIRSRYLRMQAIKGVGFHRPLVSQKP